MLIKGGILKGIHENIEYEAVDISPQDEEVIVDIKASALNRRDLWIQEGKYAKIKLPCILGSDGAGEYHGEKLSSILPSDGVLILHTSLTNLKYWECHTTVVLPKKSQFISLIYLPFLLI